MISPNHEASAFYGRRIWTVELGPIQLEDSEVRALAEILNSAGSDECTDLLAALGDE